MGIIFTPPLVVGLSALGLKGDEDGGWDEVEGSVVGWLFVVQRISLAYHSWSGCSSCEKGCSHHR